MRRNNGFLSFFIFLIFLTYVFYLTYGFFKERKEVTNNIISKIKIRSDNFYQSSENTPPVEEKPAAEVQDTVQTEEDNSNNEEQKEDEGEKPEENNTQTQNNNTENPAVEESKIKSYIRVATYNKKTDADEALKKLDGNFKVRSSKTNSGKEVFILISKTVSSNEELDKLKEKVKNYDYQVINQK